MNAVATIQPQRKSVTVDMANRFGIEPEAFEATVRATCMPANATREEFAAFCLVAKEYELNPLLREIYAFPKKGGGIIPVVSIDGWVNLINSHAAFDGMEFDVTENDAGKLVSITCKLYRKDRRLPIVVTEYLEECKRSTDPWRMERRMLRHKALIQCARYAFGFSGIYDEDEAANFADVTARAQPALEPPPAPPAPAAPEIIEPEFTEVATASLPAAATEAGDSAISSPPVPAESPATPPEPDVAFDAVEFLATLTEHLATAQKQADVVEIADLFDEEMHLLPRSRREEAEYLFEQAEARIKAAEKQATEESRQRVEAAGGKGIKGYMDEDRADEKLADQVADLEPPSPAELPDPFTVPATFASIEDYRQWVLVMAQSASTEEHATRVTTAWKTTQIARNDLQMSMTTIKELHGLLVGKIQKIRGRSDGQAG